MSKKSNIVVLDTETTGFSAKTEDVLEISIIDGYGNVLMDQLIKPVKRSVWPKAMEIHGITPEMLEDKPTFEECSHQIRGILDGKDVIIFNSKFDSAFLGNLIYGANSVQCAMLDFAEWYGEPNKRGGYNKSPWKWQSLTKACEIIKYKWEGDAHRALADCKATLAVWDFLMNLRGIEIKSIEREVIANEENLYLVFDGRAAFDNTDDGIVLSVMPNVTEERAVKLFKADYKGIDACLYRKNKDDSLEQIFIDVG